MSVNCQWSWLAQDCLWIQVKLHNQAASSDCTQFHGTQAVNQSTNFHAKCGREVAVYLLVDVLHSVVIDLDLGSLLRSTFVRSGRKIGLSIQSVRRG